MYIFSPPPSGDHDFVLRIAFSCKWTVLGMREAAHFISIKVKRKSTLDCYVAAKHDGEILVQF